MSGVYAAKFVKGLQGSDTRFIRANAGCKHFDAYGGPDSIPVQRHNFSAVVCIIVFNERLLKVPFSFVI